MLNRTKYIVEYEAWMYSAAWGHHKSDQHQKSYINIFAKLARDGRQTRVVCVWAAIVQNSFHANSVKKHDALVKDKVQVILP